MLTNVVDFSEIRVETPSIESVRSEYEAIAQQLEAATDAQSRVAACQEWDRLRRRLGSWSALTDLHFHQDTQNESYKQARDYCDEISPKLTALEIDMKRRLLGSPYRAELERSLGKQAFLLWEADITTFDPVIEDDLVREAKLVAEYTELVAGANLEFEGSRLNLSQIGKYTQDAKRDRRHHAEQVRWGFFSENRDRLDRIYDDLVRLRHQMATKLGYDNYIGLGYKRMQRVDYGQQEVARYCQQVVEEVVPLARQILERQTQKLNLDKLFYWDESLFDLQGNPTPKGDLDWMLESAQEVFAAMNPELSDFFKMMVKSHLLDLDSRTGKAGGGFCTSFLTYGLPFIFANFNGTKGDVDVFIHEMGHAFQMWQSRNTSVSDYVWATSESAEIHSMSLEFLTFSQMEKFFGDDAQRYCLQHLTESLLFLPYGVAVDRFQHLVYANPSATVKERHQMWQEVESIYLPWREYGDLTHLSQGGLWQQKQHIYDSPFYYIDYTLALCCALQFWVKAKTDYSTTLKDYVALCQRGGEAAFQELVRSARLTSPFESGALTQVLAEARQFLGL
ncbi:M3 family oligoendopeptidase [Merismopedia glauca]|uniref:Peptidase M3 n=1 Tax=Merismopedia glauca CCAP 1448/3 TaxID=1296344 RepID=A0A2T1C205_9CYAN|nr:M3 family oligoendopeptidase [Merismopedia glauca]PSB02299.1 peptidase M3 [Merismopedia glauca CCAP 1448/3]